MLRAVQNKTGRNATTGFEPIFTCSPSRGLSWILVEFKLGFA